MSAATHNFTLEQGTTQHLSLIWKDGNGVPINLSGYTARLQIRLSPLAADPLVTKTTENGGITLGTTGGQIDVKFLPADTAGTLWKKGAYDLELVAADGAVTRVVQGTVYLSLEVTK